MKLALCFAIICFGSAANCAAATSDAYTSSGIFSFGTGDGNGQFSNPISIAVSPSNNIYVVDNWNNRIQEFDTDGNFVAKWGSRGNADGQFKDPVSIAIDSTGNVYTTEYQNNRVQKFDSSGTFITKWGSNGIANGQFSMIQGVAVDSSNNVYIADMGNNRIQKFNSDGTFIEQWGTPGIEKGQLTRPTNVVVSSSGDIYVVDASSRIQKFDNKGNFQTQIGSFGNEDGQFNNPCSMTFDSEGNFYVADCNNNRIQKFSSNGIFLTKWGIYGSGNGQLYTPVGVAVDNKGNVYVAEARNNRIQKFSVNANYAAPTKPVTSFNADVLSGKAPITVKFTDTSQNATEWKWEFGDGALSNEQNPSHTYTVDGTYAVKLTSANDVGSDTEIKSSYITVSNTETPVTPISDIAPLSSNINNETNGQIVEQDKNVVTEKITNTTNVYYGIDMGALGSILNSVKNDDNRPWYEKSTIVSGVIIAVVGSILAIIGNMLVHKWKKRQGEQ